MPARLRASPVAPWGRSAVEDAVEGALTIVWRSAAATTKRRVRERRRRRGETDFHFSYRANYRAAPTRHLVNRSVPHVAVSAEPAVVKERLAQRQPDPRA